MSTGCRDCRAGLEHCHGTLIRHVEGPLSGRSECTESDCDDAELIPHTFVVDCAAIGCTCGESAAVTLAG
ncbi:hypothetical protein OSH39_06110 [Mycobacterium ulcerans]|uniref:Uncharacterized protein n=1 Tax=Mycobacterium ulcerans TaxID=1809 RepID=A0ABY3V8X0_MYCUL|nr:MULTISPECIES: hypothetical protein [Mycobacterium ulcerans group]MDC8975290.1 hypothetical protein [Mycobacterium marinum]MDC8984779.1 hypothetical protein [Mycobacterium marinum]MDC8996732.1 hypothetical protein [Mycobacterium marinum]MDC9002031.1 hypothetical protein [Mycobacterium marinum]MDC9007014.1 hypothetical protein [Mycobacterium marinum]